MNIEISVVDRALKVSKGFCGSLKVKETKVELLKPYKQRTELNIHNGHAKQDLTSRQLIIVPGRLSEPWTKTEEYVFFLALYIFAENLCQIRSFIKMDYILSYYYDSFIGQNTITNVTSI